MWVRHGVVHEGPTCLHPERHPYYEFGTNFAGVVTQWVRKEHTERLVGDLTPLPGFDQDPFVAHSPDADVPFQALVDEFVMLRRANLPLFRRLDDAAWSAIGSSSHAPLSARAAAYIMVGHVRHHATLFRDRYGLMLEA